MPFKPPAILFIVASVFKHRADLVAENVALLGSFASSPLISAELRRLIIQRWATFMHNHLHYTLAIDFAVVPSATFSILYVSFTST